MKKSFDKLLQGYQLFREKYASGDDSIMRLLSFGQQPFAMVIACCDSRVDPALLLQTEPGDLFVVRNVANIVPPYEKDEAHHGTSAALEFAIKGLKVKHLILLGHSQCGGINALFNQEMNQNDFINNWMSLVKTDKKIESVDDYAKEGLHHSYHNCFTFPWIKEAVAANTLEIHRWFFDIKLGQLSTYNKVNEAFDPINVCNQ